MAGTDVIFRYGSLVSMETLESLCKLVRIGRGLLPASPCNVASLSAAEILSQLASQVLKIFRFWNKVLFSCLTRVISN